MAICALISTFAFVGCDNGKPEGKLFYGMNSDGKSYYVQRFGADYKKEDIVIEQYYNELPVTLIYPDAFRDYTRLKSVTIPDSVTIIGNSAFMGCTSLTGIVIPDSVTIIGNGAFEGCTNLKNVTISNNVTYIRDASFYGCTSLKSVTIPDGVTEIGKEAFCLSGLTDIILGSSVKFILAKVFRECNSLTSITIPESVTIIDYSAFENCISLTSINFGGTKAQWETIAKGSDWDKNTGNYTITCSDGSIVK